MGKGLRNPFAIGCLILLAVPLCCVFSSVTTWLFNEINYQKWQSLGIETYRVNVSVGTSVYENGVVGTEVILNGRRSISPLNFNQPTIDRLFERVRQCVTMPMTWFWCHAEYDSEYGFISRLFVNDLDLGDVTVVRELQYQVDDIGE
jgi:hypothetical protein